MPVAGGLVLPRPRRRRAPDPRRGAGPRRLGHGGGVQPADPGRASSRRARCWGWTARPPRRTPGGWARGSRWCWSRRAARTRPIGVRLIDTTGQERDAVLLPPANEAGHDRRGGHAPRRGGPPAGAGARLRPGHRRRPPPPGDAGALAPPVLLGQPAPKARLGEDPAAWARDHWPLLTAIGVVADVLDCSRRRRFRESINDIVRIPTFDHRLTNAKQADR